MSVEGWLRYCQKPEVQFHKENIFDQSQSVCVCSIFLGVNVKGNVAQYLSLLYTIQAKGNVFVQQTSSFWLFVLCSYCLQIIFCRNVIIPIYLSHIFIKVRDWFSGLVFFSIFTLRANKSYHQNSIIDRAAYSVLAPIKLYPQCAAAGNATASWNKNKLR